MLCVVKMQLTVILTTFLYLSACWGEEQPLVTTPLGQVRGTYRTSAGGRTYAAFEGIPFAKPPIGDLRFEEPQPVEPWTGIWNASFLVVCSQTILTIGNISTVDPSKMNEDCLYINVYAPINAPKNLDVIVHIHGGAYMYWSGHMYAHPLYIMDHDVIFVTFNYRLGILGFLSTEDDVVPGNNGMKDQVQALKWIKDNIASFGGNPDSVTLTGMSAGGGSVHFHYLSELSRGLFHRGFSQSGTALNHWSIQEEPLTKAKLLANAVGCPTSSSSELVKCLKQRPYQHLLAQMPLFFGFGFSPAAPFAPVVEKNTKTKAFLAEQPYKLLVEGRINDLPWICSNTAHEGGPFLNNDMVEFVNNEWENVAPFLLDYNYTVPKPKWGEVAKKIKDFYLGPGQSLNLKENLEKSVAIFSDRMFLTDAENAARLQSQAGKSPVYYYLFSYPGDQNVTNFVPHGGDLKYFFSDTFTQLPLTANELSIKDMMMEMLISYAKTGKPTITDIQWEPTKPEMLKYLHFTSYKREKNQLESTEELTPRKFWKSLGMQENANLLKDGGRNEL